MKKEMIDIVRLTREGRLPEAMALIRRKLGVGQPAPSTTRTRIVDIPQIAAQSESATEPPAPQPPPAESARKTDSKAPSEHGQPGRGVRFPSPTLNGIPLKGVGPQPSGLKGGMPMPPLNLRMRGPALRQIPVEVSLRLSADG